MEQNEELVNKLEVVFFYLPHRIHHIGKIFNKIEKAKDLNFIDMIAYFVQGKLALLDNGGNVNYFGMLPNLSISGPTYVNNLNLHDKLRLSPYYLFKNNGNFILDSTPQHVVELCLKQFCAVNNLDFTKVSHIIDNEIEKYINEDTPTMAAYIFSLDGFSSLQKEHFKLQFESDPYVLVEKYKSLLEKDIKIPMDLIIKDAKSERFFDYKDEIITNFSKSIGDDNISFKDVKDFVDNAVENISNLHQSINRKKGVSFGFGENRIGIFGELFEEVNEGQKRIVLEIIDNFENRSDKRVPFIEYLIDNISKLIHERLKNKLDSLGGGIDV